LGILLSLALLTADPRAGLVVLPFLILLAASALDLRRLAGLARAVALLWTLTWIVNAFLAPGERVGPETLGWLRPSREGLRAGALQGARLAGLGAVGAWTAAVVGALELSSSLEWTVRRWDPIRRRVHALAFPAVLALRLVPLMIEEATRIRAVERLRGGPIRGIGALGRYAGFFPAWLSAILERAQGLSLALTLRGYRPDRRRGFARRYRFAPSDWGLLALGAAAVFFLGRT